MWRRVLRGTGQTLIAAGLLMGLFVVYLLWGTGVSESHGQDALRSQFRGEQARLHQTGTATSPLPVLPGYAVGIIEIPKIGVQKYVVQGTGEADLQKGPGHYPGTPLPGQPGNVAIAGHRTTYGAPFYNLDRLAPGDPVRIVMPGGVTYTYAVTGSRVVAPTDVAVVAPTPDDRLTLTTCNPRFSASTRLVVSARLVGSSTPQAAATEVQTTGPAPRNLTAGQSGAIPDVVLYGLLDAFVWGLAWGAARRFGRLVWLPGAVVFLGVLYFFFENLTRVLPPNY